MATLKKIGIENFKIFKEYTEIELKPITMLTGPNNSGKSTIMNALKILSDAALSNPAMYSLMPFTSGKITTSFDKLLNKYSRSHNMTFSLYFEDFTLIREYCDINEQEIIVEEIPLGNVVAKLTYTTGSQLRFSNDIQQEFSGSKNVGCLTEITFVDEDKKYVVSDKNDYTGLEADYYFTLAQFGIEDRSVQIDGKEELDDNKKKCQFVIYSIAKALSLVGIKNLGLSESSFLYIPPFRSEPQREYSRIDNNVISKLLFSIFDLEKYNFANTNIDAIKLPVASGFLKHFELGSEIQFKSTGVDGKFKLILIKGKQQTNVVDLGTGSINLITMFLLIERAFQFTNVKTLYYDGVSANNKWREDIVTRKVLLQEPEVHLHPNFQSLLADVFINAIKDSGVQFIIETHSEYLIQRMQYLVAAKYKDVKPNDIRIYYFNSESKQKKVKHAKGSEKNMNPKEINITEEGRLTENFGTGFFDESTKTIFKLWTVQGHN